MSCRWMKEVYHWLWLFQNCLIEYCHPDIHGLPELLRKWLVRNMVSACFNRRILGFTYRRTLCFLWCLANHTCGKMRAPGVLYSFRYYIMWSVYKKGDYAYIKLKNTCSCLLYWTSLIAWVFSLFKVFWLRIFGGGCLKCLSSCFDPEQNGRNIHS